MTIINMHGEEVQILSEHIFRAKSAKTVCVSAALAYFGVTPDMYTVTSTNKNLRAYHGILRRHGLGVRSRASATRKAKSVGQLRKLLPKVAKNETENVVGYLVAVPSHVLVLDINGVTVVDTAPRKRDARKLVQVHAIVAKSS
jgi:hypothetical protein